MGRDWSLGVRPMDYGRRGVLGRPSKHASQSTECCSRPRLVQSVCIETKTWVLICKAPIPSGQTQPRLNAGPPVPTLSSLSTERADFLAQNGQPRCAMGFFLEIRPGQPCFSG